MASSSQIEANRGWRSTNDRGLQRCQSLPTQRLFRGELAKAFGYLGVIGADSAIPSPASG